VEKERKAAEAATAKAEKARADAEEQQKQLEEAEKDLQKKMEEVQALLEETKAKGGTPLGAIWWMEKDLAEARKFMSPKGK